MRKQSTAPPPGRNAFGEPLPAPRRSQEALLGMAEIEAYAGFCESVLKDLATSQGFPMLLIGGKWVASCRRIDEWFYAQFPTKNKA